MATTQQYLTSLKNDMETLKTNIAEKGVEVTESDNFTTLSAKVADIQAGSSLPDLKNANDIYSYTEEHYSNIDKILNNQVNKRSTYTDSNVTLYTPNIDYKNYVIFERNNGTYKIVWTQRPYLYRYSSTVQTSRVTNLSTSVEANTIKFSDLKVSTLMFETYNTSITTYNSPEYSTLEEAIQAILSNSTQYNAISYGYYGSKGTSDAIKYSNMPAFDSTYEIIDTVKRVSQNETITQI